MTQSEINCYSRCNNIAKEDLFDIPRQRDRQKEGGIQDTSSLY